MDIAWYHGDSRADDFTVSTSTDGSSFATAYTGTSTGTSTSFEHYPFATRRALATFASP